MELGHLPTVTIYKKFPTLFLTMFLSILKQTAKNIPPSEGKKFQKSYEINCQNKFTIVYFSYLNIGNVWIHRLWCYVWLTQRPISQSNTIVELNKRTLRVLAKILAKLIFKFQYYALMGKNCKWYIIHFKDKILFTPPYQ